MGLSTNFSYADYTNTFVNMDAKNTLLSTLNVFSDRQTSASPKVSLDIIDEVAQKVASSVNRYGSEWSSIPKRSASNHLIEAPLYAYQDRITAADVQPYRKPGSDLQMSVMDAVTSSAVAMHDKYMRTRERIFADALFRNTVEATYTQQPIISWEDEFGYQQATGTIKTNVSSGDPLRSLDDAVTAAKVRIGALLVSLMDLSCLQEAMSFAASSITQTCARMFSSVCLIVMFCLTKKCFLRSQHSLLKMSEWWK